MKKVFYTLLFTALFSLMFTKQAVAQCSVPSGTVGVTPKTYGYTILESGTNVLITLTPDVVSTGATLYLNGGFGGAGVSNGAGGYSWNPTLSSGSVVTFYFLFFSGGQQQTKTYTYTVGTCGGTITSPVTTITSPAANASFIAPATIVINADATAPPGSVITRVDFFANDGTNNISLGASLTAPYTVTWNNVPAGNYIILALASDDSARTGSSPAVHISVSTPPSGGYCGTGTTNPTGDPDYEWKAITTPDSITMIFHPIGRAVGCDLAIWNTSVGGFGMNLQPNGDLTKTIAKGSITSITFFFTYRLGAGGPETNTSGGPQTYIVGSDCTATLPVKLADYVVKKSASGSVGITWTTLSESNSDYFKIESGYDASHFAVVGKVNAKGNSSEKQYYAYTDNSYKGGIKYYRLSQVDKDGKTTYYDVKMINSIKADVEEIFPNPLKASTFYVKLKSGLNDNFNVQVLSTSGKMIYSGNVTPHESLLKISLPVIPAPGIYIVKVNNNPYKLLVQ